MFFKIKIWIKLASDSTNTLVVILVFSLCLPLNSCLLGESNEVLGLKRVRATNSQQNVTQRETRRIKGKTKQDFFMPGIHNVFYGEYISMLLRKTSPLVPGSASDHAPGEMLIWLKSLAQLWKALHNLIPNASPSFPILDTKLPESSKSIISMQTALGGRRKPLM